jgi:hypothetical protein
MRKMTIVDDNARSSGIVRQRQWYHTQYVLSPSSSDQPLKPFKKRDYRWSSNICSTNSTEKMKSLPLHNCLQHFVDRGLFEMDQRVPRETTTIGSSVSQGLCFDSEDSPGSPRLPTRRASIEDEQAKQLTALEACWGYEEDDDDNDYNNATHSRVVTNDLDDSPLDEERPKAIKENNQLIIARTEKSCQVSSGHSCNHKNSSIFHRIPAIRSKPESRATSTRRIASQIDRILRGIDVSTIPHSNNKAELLADGILLPPVRRKSWLDEEEREEENVGHDRKVMRRPIISGVHSW